MQKCELRIDRQLNAAINLYLQMEGLSPTPRLLDELVKGWSGFTLTGDETGEGPNELERSPRLLNPKSYVVINDYVAQNPKSLLVSLTINNQQGTP
jgi:hypothetical protein